jgi:uncharacterized protein
LLYIIILSYSSSRRNSKSSKTSQNLAVFMHKLELLRPFIFTWFYDKIQARLMTKEIEEIKEKVTPILKEEGVLRSAIFGSVVRGEDTKDSDVDILIQPPEGMTLFGLVALERKLGEAVGKKVDLVTYRSLHHLLRDRIMAEQVPIYE